jgi:hypothetical protein
MERCSSRGSDWGMGMVDPGDDGPREWRTLGMADPGDGLPKSKYDRNFKA